MEMEKIQQQEQQQEQQHEHKLQQHLQQHLQQQEHLVKAADQQQQQQLSRKEVWHRKTSVMEIFRSSLGNDDEIIEEEEEHCQDFTSSASPASPSSRFPQTKSQSRGNVWGPVYLNRDRFIDMHLR